ncbi:MAG: helix-turn-helix domain-containing protein [Lachnospiraceae bacterium]|nr:helix-turn-helix domain-containing protein [Lachnospiraceae bacterium]
MDEQKKYETIRKLVDNGGSKECAALKLGVTRRHINRMIHGYKEKGKQRKICASLKKITPMVLEL